eukprot:superscaffoldBa00001819_g12159
MSLKTKKKTRASFGATAPPFIDYLKDVLRRYPDGGQILKELIQNADDAQATEVVFIHDERSYGTESLWTDELGKYQGPALYAYNNAAFTDDDWKGIQTSGRSVKRNDPNKVGRFGIGFNSVYHITDVPGIFSSGHLGLMDPQEKVFGERQGGFQWSLKDEEDQEALMNMHDQFKPFQDILSHVSRQEWSKVIMEDQHFNGTIFRFPLRNEASDISDNLYDSDRVVQLFDSFIADADLSLLFLKHVTTVSLIHISVDGSVNIRLEVKSSVPTDVILESEDNTIREGSTRFKLITLNSEDHKETKWLLTTCTMKEGNVEKIDSLAKKLSFFPQVDLAFPCGEKRDCSESRLSCFLPLPNNESNKTGLPVYVNACFGLTDNRRYIKWQEEDQKHDEHAVWNELLMKEVLPQAYLMIIQDAIKLAQEGILQVSSVYDLWPDIAQIQHKDKWYVIALDVLHHLFRENMAVLSLAEDERKFISPSEAVFPCNGPTSPDILAAIKRTLISCGENLVTLPDSIASTINEGYPHPETLRHVTPAFLKDILHRTGVHNLSKEDKLCLLEYILSDGKYRELQGLLLLPLSDGSFRSFTSREEDTALIDSNEFPRTLLPCCKHLFIPDDLSPACSAHLKQLAREKLFKVINIDADQVKEYTKRYLPEDWKPTRTGLVTWDISNSHIIEAIHLPVLGQLLTCDDLQDVQRALAMNGIHDIAETESFLPNSHAPGTDIPEEWHDSLDMNILNNFEEGEYVGYMLTNNKYIYAVIVEELPGYSGQYSQRYKIEIGEDEPIEVSCVDLYQFKCEKKPKPAEASCMELVLLAGAVPNSSQPSSTRSSPTSVEEAKREIDKCLAEIWTLPEEEKRKAIRRLYLRWHPDKNLDCQSLANEAVKYLQNRVDELSKGKGKTAGTSYPGGRSHFRDFYQQWNQEARHHRSGRERFSRGNRSYNFWTHHGNIPRPNGEEARRWCRQARCDLNAAYKDTGGGSTEWCLFKVHQAVEKSLKAAQYKRHGNPSSSSISAIAEEVSLYHIQLRDLPQIVDNLKTLGVDAKKTQYPNCHPFPHIPNGQFKAENELQAVEKASELLSRVEAYVN